MDSSSERAIPFDRSLFNDPEVLVIEDLDPKHAKEPKSFVLSANGERYRNTRAQRKKAKKVQKRSRKINRK